MGKIPDVGSGVVWGAIFTLIFDNKVAGKLRRIILIHSGLVSFHFHFPKIRKVLIPMTLFSPGPINSPSNDIN